MLCQVHSLVFTSLQPFCARNSEGYAAAFMGLYLQKNVIFCTVICLSRVRINASQHMQSAGGHPTNSEPVPANCTASRSFDTQSAILWLCLE